MGGGIHHVTHNLVRREYGCFNNINIFLFDTALVIANTFNIYSIIVSIFFLTFDQKGEIQS